MRAVVRGLPTFGQPPLSMALVCSTIKCNRAKSRLSSASVFGGIGTPSGVRNVSSRPVAFGPSGRVPNAEANERVLDPVDDPRPLSA